jgi:putative intracellular protease/amidase
MTDGPVHRRATGAGKPAPARVRQERSRTMKTSLRLAWAGIMLVVPLGSGGWGKSEAGAVAASAHPTAARDHMPALAAPKSGRTRPQVVVLADNAGTETTDFIVPYGVLKASGVADVVSVSTEAGSVALFPALRVKTDMTIAQFDRTQPAGADVLIVPAMKRKDSPVLLEWVKGQADKGAVVVSVCEGAWVIAHAGLLDGKSATTHWFALDSMAGQFPGTTWVRDRRWVVDGNIVSTTGVSASIPASLALIEAIAGLPAAHSTARQLGVSSWDAAHDSSGFAFRARHVAQIAWNWLAFWRHETVELALADGVDEVAIALTADAWSRTMRSRVVAVHAGGSVRSRHGLEIESDEALAGAPSRLPGARVAAKLDLDAIIDGIAARHGSATACWVAIGLEYRLRSPDRCHLRPAMPSGQRRSMG